MNSGKAAAVPNHKVKMRRNLPSARLCALLAGP